MSSDSFHGLQIAVSSLTAAATALLGMMFWNSSLTNREPFTKAFLRVLSLASVLNAVEIACSVYRTARIAPAAIPFDGTVAGLMGRTIELAGYLILIWFVLRPETKHALNGASSVISKSGELPPDYWHEAAESALRRIIKPEFLKRENGSDS